MQVMFRFHDVKIEVRNDVAGVVLDFTRVGPEIGGPEGTSKIVPDERFVLHLGKASARSIASAIMGAAAAL